MDRAERWVLVLLSLLIWIALLVLLTGCVSYRDTRELVLGNSVSAVKPPIGATSVEVVSTDRTKILQTCLLFPPAVQLRCVLLHI